MQSADRALLFVMMDIPAEHDAELNRWYQEEHLPERAACPGFLNARRFRAVMGVPLYLATYDLTGLGALETPEYQRLLEQPSEWTRRIGKLLAVNVRNVYVDRTPDHVRRDGPHPDTKALLAVMIGVAPEHDAAVEDAEIADEIAAATTGPLDLVGVAVGGIVAQHLLVRHGDRVRSAVLACTTGSTRAAGESMRARAEEAERDGMTPLTDVLLRRWFTPAAIRANGPGVCYARDRIQAMDPRAYGDTLRAFAEHDLLTELASCQQPVTLITGADDEVGRGSQELLARYLPRHRRITLPGSHMLHLERPVPFGRSIDGHLAWVGEAAA